MSEGFPEITEEELVDLLDRYKRDFIFFADRILKVLAMEGKIVPFQMNGPQKILHRIVTNIEEAERLIRIIALKARRMGFSTYFSGRNYHKTSWNFNRLASQVTHEPEATETLFGMVKRFYDFTPEWLRPTTRANNAKLLEFNNKEGKGLGSGFRVATAAKEDFGSGQLIHYFHGCLSPDTPILIADGREKKIKDIRPGDEVVTHNGNFGKVVAISRKKAEEQEDRGETITVHPWLGEPITMTRQHKVWTNMGWVKAGDLDPNWHLVSMPIRPITNSIKALPVKGRPAKFGPRYTGPDEFPLTRETGFAVGYYLAEGCTSRTKGGLGPYQRIIFALHADEDAFAHRACAALRPFCKSPPKVKARQGTLTKTYALDSGVLAAFIAETFGCVDQKHIPDWVFEAGEEFCRGLVLGYLSGDGSKTIGGSGYDDPRISATSIRPSLVYQVRDLIAALGYGWGSVTPKAGGIVSGRNCRPAWVLRLNGKCAERLRWDLNIPFVACGAASDRATRYRLDPHNGKVWLKIKKIEKSFCEEVYDFEVDHEDHSYRTPSFAVSNSELAKWPEETIDSLLTAILQCIPDDLGTEVVFESTAKGVGGEFYDRFWKARYRVWVKKMARPEKDFWYDADTISEAAVVDESINDSADKENLYTSIFLPWFCFERYQAKAPEGLWGELTKEELDMMEEYGLTIHQLYWRRQTIANKCKGSVDTFNQEYPSCPEHAFLTSGRPVFDNTQVMRLKNAAPTPVARYECMTGLRQWVAKADGRLKVWKEPKVGRAYIVSADVAEGLEHGDYSCADVIDHRTGEQVAQWHGHIDYDLFSIILVCLARKYNEALIAPERNNHGLTVVKRLCDEGYPNLYGEMVPEPPGRPRKRFGWLTTSATRPLIIDQLVSEMREGVAGINCAETYEEMLAFKIQANGRMEADKNRFDDRVMSLAIGKFLRQSIPLPAPKGVSHLKKGDRGMGGRKRPSSKGWT